MKPRISGRTALSIFVAGCVLATAPQSASAATVWDNGSAIPGSGGPNLERGGIAADDFRLTAAAILTGGTFTFSGSPANLGAISFHFYANAGYSSGGSGYDRPGLELASGVAAITSIEPLSNPGYIAHFLAAFTFATPFQADADTLYWFGLSSSATEPVGWVASNFFSRTRTYEHRWYLDPGVFQVIDPDLAFTLNAAYPKSPVPEPDTWALMILGFAILGRTLRRPAALA